jgi:hypothetical protein
MSALFTTKIPMPIPYHKHRIVATEREVCSNLVEVFAFSLLLITCLDLRINLVKVKFRMFARISLKFTMKKEQRTPKITGIKHIIKLDRIIFRLMKIQGRIRHL